MDPLLYDIQSLPWREQLHDTYRTAFYPVFIGVLVSAAWLLHHLFGGLEFYGPLIGASVGLLPSLRLSTPARMLIAGPADRAQIDAWLGSHRHVRDARGWVPTLPRALYFDSQIVRYDGDAVVAPVIILRQLRKVLRAASCLRM